MHLIGGHVPLRLFQRAIELIEGEVKVAVIVQVFITNPLGIQVYERAVILSHESLGLAVFVIQDEIG